MINLAEMHYEYGLIGISEYVERCDIAAWLYEKKLSGSDPRSANDEPEQEADHENQSINQSVTSRQSTSTSSDDPEYIEFLFMGWIFIKGDPDPYPSTPHGHLGSKTRQWPKLNPYNGRVFSAMHQEDKSRRLSKKSMSVLWNDESFKDFCRSHLVWYRENFSHYTFPVHKDRILLFPRWRKI